MTKRGSIDHAVHHVRLGDAKREEALEHYRQAGEGLRKLKQLVGHGRFTGTKRHIASVLAISDSRIRQLIQLSREWRANGSVDWDRWQEICGNKKPQPPGVPQGRPNADQKANWGRQVRRWRWPSSQCSSLALYLEKNPLG